MLEITRMNDLFLYDSLNDALDVLENLAITLKKIFEVDQASLIFVFEIMDNLINVYQNEMVRRDDNFDYTKEDRDNLIKVKNLFDRIILMSL